MSVLSMVADPQFQNLSPSDQQTALSGLDPAFGGLSAGDFNTAVTGLQKQALARPDLVAPPKIAGSSQPMQTSALGSIYDAVQNGPGQPIPSPKAAGATSVADNVQSSTGARGVVNDIAAGALDGGLQTAHTVLRGVNAATGDSISSLPTTTDEPDTLKPTNTAQSIGMGAEGILELMSGDEALKGLSLSSKLGLASKVAELAESSPTLAKAIDIGLNAVRQGAVTGGETLAKGGSTADALEAGAGGAALSGAAQSVLPAFGALKNLVSPAADIQPELQSGLRGILNDAVEGEVTQPDSIRDAAQSAGDTVYDQAKANFKVLDDATGGNVSRFDNQIRTVNRALQNVTDDDEEAKLLTRKASLEAGQESAFDQAKAAGVDPKLVDQAKADYKQAQALYDLDSSIKKSVVSTSGRPGVTPADALAKNPETVDPKKLATRINAMYDSGRLQEALGDQGAKDLFIHSQALNTKATIVANAAKTAGKLKSHAITGAIAGVSGAIGAGVVGHKMLKHLVPVSVEADPADPDSTDAAAPDIPALSGSSKPAPDLGALVDEPAVMPRMAVGRDYIDDPSTQSAIEDLYNRASPTFIQPSLTNEHMITLGKDGSVQKYEGQSAMGMKASIPSDSQAIIHTHPMAATPVPSDQDYKTATKAGIPNFVVSRNAIYVAMPNGDEKHPLKVADISPGKHGHLNIKWNS